MPRLRLLPTLSGLTLLAVSPAQGHRVHSCDGPWQIRAEGTQTWQRIEVPSSFETVLGNDFDGRAEYRRRLPAAGLTRLAPEERVFLRFRAVATHAEVFLHSPGGRRHRLGEHLGAWTPFRFRIDGLLRAAPAAGAWQIEVQVDERVGHNTQGFLPVIAPHFGGIWQGVDILRVPAEALDPDQVELRCDYDGRHGRLRIHTGLRDTHWRARLDERLLPAPGAGNAEYRLAVSPWSPAEPRQYQLVLERLDGRQRVRDRLTRKLAFVGVRAEGHRIQLNGRPLVVRGLLHWGYEPPLLAPNRDQEYWARQFRFAKARGFNLIKACLWVPPPAFFAAAAETGILVWQEYPAWHPDFSSKHLPALEREYREFFRLDRGRSVILCRSLTCETGRAAAEAAVVKRLYDLCKKVTGAALVEDDSSWIAWNRFHDFYDDHPYGNCGDWLTRLRGFEQHIAKHGAKPLLLGEAITADTWLDFPALDRAIPATAWWRPWAYQAQRQFAVDLDPRLGTGAAARLMPDSKRYAMLARKYQIETFRSALPHAGYVVSVIRDFRKARMGLLDDLDRPKWQASDWTWHRDEMYLLRDLRPRRGLGRREGFPAIRRGKLPALVADTKKTARNWDGRKWQPVTEQLGALSRVDVQVEGADGLRNQWRFYLVDEEAAVTDARLRVQSYLDPQTLDWVAQGGRLLLTAGGKGALRSQRLWFLRGAPFAPITHPLFERVPRDMLFHLQPMDWDGPVFLNTPLLQAMQPILGFWDSHDRKDELETYALLAEARLGKGRILACALNTDSDQDYPARAWLRAQLAAHLLHGPAPRALIPPALIARARPGLTAQQLGLDGVWRLKPDKADQGLAQNWQRPGLDDGTWMKAQAGRHWENLGLHHDGVAWYRRSFALPAFHRPGQALYAVFEGVDDSYTLFINGKRVASFGDPKTGETVWLKRTKADISGFVKAGENLICLRVVDHGGAGGLHRPVFLTNADPALADLLNR